MLSQCFVLFDPAAHHPSHPTSQKGTSCGQCFVLFDPAAHHPSHPSYQKGTSCGQCLVLFDLAALTLPGSRTRAGNPVVSVRTTVTAAGRFVVSLILADWLVPRTATQQ